MSPEKALGLDSPDLTRMHLPVLNLGESHIWGWDGDIQPFIELFVLEGTFRAHLVQLSCNDMGLWDSPNSWLFASWFRAYQGLGWLLGGGRSCICSHPLALL